jgi:acetyl-CoA acetyltransferase
MHPWGKFPDSTFVDLGVVATRNALADAGIRWSDVEFLGASIHIWGGLPGAMAGNQVVQALGETGIPVTNSFGACSSAGAAMRAAYLEIATGAADIAVALGADKSPDGFLPQVPKVIQVPLDVDDLRWKVVGASNPVYWALECRRRMAEVGTTEADLAQVKVLLSRHGSQNPLARFRREFSASDVLSSPMVCDPLHLLELCTTSDGAAAVVLCSDRVAKQRQSTGVRVRAVTLGTAETQDPSIRMPFLSVKTNGTGRPLSESSQAAARAYNQAGIEPKEIDFVELPDNSAWHVLAYLEAIGMCDSGEPERMLRAGELSIDGRLPVCPSGGLSSLGEAVSAQGLAQVCEIAWQLRGMAGNRQVPRARAGLGQVYGLFGASSTVILTT